VTRLAANVGAVITASLVLYQQEASIDKSRGASQVRTALPVTRLDSALRTIVTQIVMIAIVVG
jgi:Mn2+/Fe2+ NRAMP family transporter